ncbi:restriction endonuclease subunit S [Pseudoalteromonas lipolytica]|uniref:Type I restriction modification DNA specificity domain-containing protein n=1 Tax=Pseudoalteromonas lipolytica TaxID=570156 RepID=A0ABY1GEC2_9GAMM|nr:restriction endonuclease subunit S [Pseudoalteromonas lipolytica]MBE0352820.1 type I restriction enzyme, S subunit [Pseudoalteromonas lipolytica LMEB 39]SFT41508.1 Type I restriction modification DNA specificity domain-containing protein [Pseudoalteromonas lipolytica]
MSFFTNSAGWPLVPLKEVATLKRGYDLPTKNRVEGDVPIYAANGQNGFHNEVKIQAPGVITGRSGTIGKVHYTEEDYWPLNTALYVTDFHSNYSKWVYYMLQAFKLERFVEGAGVPTLNRNLVHDELIPLPPLEVQKRIAAILDKADSVRRKRQQAIDLAEDFLRSVFLDMFGDPISNPKRWEVKKLKEISSKIASGNTPNGGSKNYVDEGITFLRSQNVWKNKLLLDDVVYIDEKTHESMSKSSLKHKDILMTKTGRINTVNSSLGRAALYLGDDGKANLNGHVYFIRLVEDVLHEFVVFILTTIEYRDYIRSVCVGGIDKRQLNKDHLEEFPIIYPPKEMQEQFVEKVNVARSMLEKAKLGLKESEQMFNGLSQKAFAGEL